MPRPNFIGLSKSKDGSWKVHYQHHNPTLRFSIKSLPRKYFSIKEYDDGEISIKYYDKELKICSKSFDYASVLHELFPSFNGNEIDAECFIKNNQEILFSKIKSSIYHYCLENKKEFKEYDVIQNRSGKIWCESSETGDKNDILNKFCELVNCTRDDLEWAIKEYRKEIANGSSYCKINETVRERSIVHHYPRDKK